jgi:hypothetical protein
LSKADAGHFDVEDFESIDRKDQLMLHQFEQCLKVKLLVVSRYDSEMK